MLGLTPIQDSHLREKRIRTYNGTVDQRGGNCATGHGTVDAAADHNDTLHFDMHYHVCPPGVFQG
jgi:hypothetical protein